MERKYTEVGLEVLDYLILFHTHGLKLEELCSQLLSVSSLSNGGKRWSGQTTCCSGRWPLS